MTASRTAFATALTLCASAGAAAAAPVIGLVDGTTLAMFDSQIPAELSMMPVTGAEMLVGIDYRPGNGTLVGVTADNRIGLGHGFLRQRRALLFRRNGG